LIQQQKDRAFGVCVGDTEIGTRIWDMPNLLGKKSCCASVLDLCIENRDKMIASKLQLPLVLEKIKLRKGIDRFHQSSNYKTPDDIYFQSASSF
jgi:hypothetical protein